MLDKVFGKKKKETNKNSNQINFEYGVEYIEKKEFEPAIESFKRCIDVNPEDSKAFVGLCIAYSGLMDLETAREYYNELKDIDPYLAAQLANTQTGLLLDENKENEM